MSARVFPAACRTGPWARALTEARQADNMKDSPDGRCLPLSTLWLHSHPDLLEFICLENQKFQPR